MTLKTLVKISEVTNLSDARYCAGMGVDLIGFPLDESHPKFIDLAKAKEISSWICGIKVVGEFEGNDPKTIAYLAQQLGLEYIQLNKPVSTEEIRKIPKPVILKLEYGILTIAEIEILLNEYAEVVHYFLLESKEESFEDIEEKLKDWTGKYKIILGFGIRKDTLPAILEEIKPAGISLKGGEELRPGLKTFDELADILEELETDD